MSRNTTIFFGLVALVVLGGLAFVFVRSGEQVPAPIACTEEAKICPDGSAVGRTGLNCEFAACPTAGTPTSTPTSTPISNSSTTIPVPPAPKSNTATLGQKILYQGVYITPLEVLEDSRCPGDVQCIQAGTVRLRTVLEKGGETETTILTLGAPIRFENSEVILSDVLPYPISTRTIKNTDYRFTFSVKTVAAVSNGTLAGTMTIRPVCPVERIENPCKATPEMFAARKIAVYTADRQTLITTITPTADGTFSVSLPSGSYYVSMLESTPRIGGATGVPTTVTIRPDATVELTIDVDTGIR